jgi:ribosomal-protein-alanine N-acetyltransferase
MTKREREAAWPMTIEIRLATCTLRPLTPADAASIAMHANDRDIWLNLRDRFPHPYALHDAEEYIAHVSPIDPPRSFGIVVGGAAVGNITLTPQSDIERVNAELGYWLGRAHWGRGIMTDAIRGMTSYGFRTFGLTRIFAVPFVHNIGSIRALEKSGYRREGLMRRSAIKDGVVYDQFLYATYDLTAGLRA